MSEPRFSQYSEVGDYSDLDPNAEAIPPRGYERNAYKDPKRVRDFLERTGQITIKKAKGEDELENS